MNDATKTIAIGGASGLVGTVLQARLNKTNPNVRVLRMVRRREEVGSDTIYWSPASGEIDVTRFEEVDTVVNLAGEAIGPKRWTANRKKRIVSSRIDGTRLLAGAFSTLNRKPKVFVQASAVGYYGHTGDALVDESSPRGEGFLAGLCERWEAESQAAKSSGLRVVNLRLGHVLSSEGGLLDVMQTPFKFGVGGTFGNGRQYWSWIVIDDLVELIVQSIFDESYQGVINATTPNPVTNGEFARELATVLRRSSFINVPAIALKAAFGPEQAREMLLWGQRVRPKMLEKRGFEYRHPVLDEALRTLLKA